MRRRSIQNLKQLVLWLALVLCLRSVPAFSAETQTASSPPIRTQFLLIVDESASMGNAPPRTDPDRLAILAARLFLSILAPEDRANVAGMNELATASGQAATSFSLLPPEKAIAEATNRLDPNGTGLAAYRGAVTPCRSALASAKVLLDSWHEKDGEARQVLVFLTDGRCEGTRPGSEDPEPAQAWLDGLASARKDPDLFRFFFLRFEGNQASESLAEYARVSGGRELRIPAGSRRARGIVQAFADVFAGAQGYATEFIGIAGTNERSFGRAERVRVLALRSAGDTSPLELKVTAAGGQAPPFELSPVQRFQRTSDQGLNAYEYRIATVVPNGTRFKVQVLAADGVLIPDYRSLRASLTVVPGTCPGETQKPLNWERDTDYVPSGSTACVQVGLRGSRGWLAPADDLEFVGQFQKGPGGTGTFADLENMVPRVDGFSANLPVDADSYVDLRGKVTIAGMPIPLFSHPHPLRGQTITWNIRRTDRSEPTNRVEIGRMNAGETRAFELEFEGRFPSNLAVKVVPQKPLSGHPCLDVRIAAGGGTSIQVSPGQTRKFEIVSKPCRIGGTVSAMTGFVPDEKASLQAIEVPIEIDFIATPWWTYWGGLVIRILIALFFIVTLVCAVNGWRKPARQLPPNKKGLAFFHADDIKLLKKPSGEFLVPGDHMGAYLLSKHLDGGGWYRNAAIPLGAKGCRLPSPGLSLPLELQPGPGRFRGIQGSRHVQLFAVNLDHRPGPAEDYPAVPFGPPAATLGSKVGPVCRLYARLFGRLPKVQSVMIDEETWYRIGDRDSQYFFKIGSTPL